MTTEQILQYYVNLLILQYAGKPNAEGMISACVSPVLMDQLPIQVLNAFQLGTAVGVQLDILGKYAGVSRSAYVDSTLITLNDIQYLTLIRLAILNNTAGSSLGDIASLLNTYFPNEILAFDFQNMHMSYLVSSMVGDQNLVKIFIQEGLLPKPMGVQLASVIYVPVITNFFSFVTYDVPTYAIGKGFNTYDTYDTDAPWLSYSDAI